MRSLCLLVACIGLAGCTGQGPLPGLGLFGAGEGRGVATLSLRSGAVDARAPQGYCADRSVSQPRDGFAVFASCLRVTGSGTAPLVDGLVMVQVGGADTAAVTGGEEVLAGVLLSERGRSLLASGGSPESLQVADIEMQPGLVTVEFRDEAATGPEGLGPVVQRAFLDVGGHLVTVSVRSFDTAPLSPGAQRSLLGQAIDSLRDANAADAKNAGE